MAVEAREVDLTVFKVKSGNPTLKIDDKGGRGLRIEVAMSRISAAANPGKVIQVAQTLGDMVVRFLGIDLNRDRNRHADQGPTVCGSPN